MQQLNVQQWLQMETCGGIKHMLRSKQHQAYIQQALFIMHVQFEKHYAQSQLH